MLRKHIFVCFFMLLYIMKYNSMKLSSKETRIFSDLFRKGEEI